MCRKLPLRRRSINTIGTSYRVGVCRRQDCRKHHVAFFYAAAVFPEDAATITGKNRDYARRLFCPRSGSSVFARSDDAIEVHLKSINAPDDLRPTYENWTVHRLAWLMRFPKTPHYKGEREATPAPDKSQSDPT